MGILMALYRETSREAWESFLPVSALLDRAIMAALDAAGHRGLTCQEVERAIGRSHQAVSGNLRHLVEKGLVLHSGEYGQTDSGRRAILWIALKHRATKPARVFEGEAWRHPTLTERLEQRSRRHD